MPYLKDIKVIQLKLKHRKIENSESLTISTILELFVLKLVIKCYLCAGIDSKNPMCWKQQNKKWELLIVYSVKRVWRTSKRRTLRRRTSTLRSFSSFA